MVTVQANTLRLKDVHERLGYQRYYADQFEDFLILTELTDHETTELLNIRSEFDRYLVEGNVLEGQVRILSVNPLLRLSGFNRAPITIEVELAIEPIELPESQITGRMDLLAIRRGKSAPDFWVLVVESKESGADAMQGLSQLLTYAYTSLQEQRSVWGLATNGINYQFVQIQAGQPPQYFLLPELNLLHRSSASSLLQVLKAICQT
ncbi:MAG: restriction endonuclease subunit R [Alkalinema sp. RU_4_3]|nr:restriction endonuclease subunit R [Alkalinema sp. RU_4_3]